MINKDKITEIFCIADDFCKLYEDEIKSHLITQDQSVKRFVRKPRLSDSEIITIQICFHNGTFRNFKHYYQHYIKVHLQQEFPDSISYNRFVELQPRVIAPFLMFLKLLCFGKCTGISFVDSTPIRVCNNKRIKRNKVFKDTAQVGKSTMGWFFGFKLHLIVNEKGDLLNFALTQGNVDDRNPKIMAIMTRDLFGKLYADKGYISSTLFETLFYNGIHIVTGIKNNMANRLMSLSDKVMLRKRSVIETINDELKNICVIEHSRHRSTHNFLMNIVSALVAYSFFPKKPSIKVDYVETGQLSLF